MQIKTVVVALPDKVGYVNYTGLSIPVNIKMLSTACYTGKYGENLLAVTFISD